MNETLRRDKRVAGIEIQALRLFLLAGAIYGGGAVGVEHFTDSEVNSLHYNMWTALEEGMEMLGVIVFIYALLDYLRGSPERVVRLDIGIDTAGGS